MANTSTTSPALQPEAETTVDLLDNWFDAIEVGLRERVRDFIQVMIEGELDTALARPRYGRRPKKDVRNGDGLRRGDQDARPYCATGECSQDVERCLTAGVPV